MPAVTTLIRAPIAARLVLVPDQLDRQPVVSLAGVLKEHVVIFVAVDGAAGLDEDVDVAVVVPVAAGHAVALLKVARAGGAGDLGEPLARRRS